MNENQQAYLVERDLIWTKHLRSISEKLGWVIFLLIILIIRSR